MWLWAAFQHSTSVHTAYQIKLVLLALHGEGFIFILFHFLITQEKPKLTACFFKVCLLFWKCSSIKSSDTFDVCHRTIQISWFDVTNMFKQCGSTRLNEVSCEPHPKEQQQKNKWLVHFTGKGADLEQPKMNYLCSWLFPLTFFIDYLNQVYYSLLKVRPVTMTKNVRWYIDPEKCVLRPFIATDVVTVLHSVACTSFQRATSAKMSSIFNTGIKMWNKISECPQ